MKPSEAYRNLLKGLEELTNEKYELMRKIWTIEYRCEKIKDQLKKTGYYEKEDQNREIHV